MAWWDIPTPQTAPYFPPAGGPYPIPPQQPPAFATDPLENAHGTGPQGNVAGSLAAIGGNLGQQAVDWYQRQPSWLEQMGAMQQRADQYPLGVLDPAMRSQAGGLLGGIGGGAIGSIKAYHGSPHDFNAFDLSKIGTGEGAQVYGHGLYFAENPATATAYRDALTQRNNPLDEQYRRFLTSADENHPGEMPPEGLDLHMLPKMGEERASISNSDLISRAQQNLADVQGGKGPLAVAAVKRAQDTLDYLKGNPGARFVGTPYQGRMYEVNINADPEHFLDWDKPLSEQHPKVQEIIPQLNQYKVAQTGKTWEVRHPGGWVPNGAKSYYRSEAAAQSAADEMNAQRHISDLVPMTADAAAKLRDAGIPGIKYLDQGSRGVGNGTHNYVVFDDKLIDIARKYGMAGLMLGSGVAGMPLQSPPYLSQSQ
jgi:hypothetical protein